MAQATYPAVPDVASIELQWVVTAPYNNIEAQCTLYWRDPVATRNVAYLVELAEDMTAAYGATAGLEDLLQTWVTLESIVVKDLDTEPPHLSHERDVAIAGAGGTAATLPLTTTAVVRLPVQNAGVPTKTYIRHPILAESNVEGNTVNATARGQIANAWMAVLLAFETSQPDGELVVISVYEPGGVEPNIYRDVGLYNPVATDALTVRPLVGRAASRQT